MGLIVTFGAVGGVLYKIHQKKKEREGDFDYDEGGERDDSFVMIN